MGNSTNEDNWASRERLRVIERALWWRGWVGRKDITGLFGVSAAQASGDLQRYQELNPGSLIYHTSRKRYEATPQSSWVLNEPSFEEALSVFFEGGNHVYPSNCGGSSRVAGVGLPPRKGAPGITRNLMIATLGDLSVEIEYLSLTSRKAGWRTIVPHAFGNDGYRWHVRAWCPDNRGYRDFVISRMKNIKWPQSHSIELPGDADWSEFVILVLKPNQALSEKERQAIELDYGIEPGGVLKVPVRVAMKNYLMSHLRVVNESERFFQVVR